jgi:hypothetical protein
MEAVSQDLHAKNSGFRKLREIFHRDLLSCDQFFSLCCSKNQDKSYMFFSTNKHASYRTPLKSHGERSNAMAF